MIEIQNLAKIFGNHTALNIQSLTIQTGECFGLVGNNGAGKTTLFRCLLDLIEPSTGQVLFNNQKVAQSEHWKAYTGSYLESNFLIPFLTPKEYFQFVANVYGLDKPLFEKRLESYVPLLTEETVTSKKYLRDLSMGNQHKVGIVAALLIQPQILILDEPFANLDPSSQMRLKKILIEVRDSANTTILISSHDLNYVYEICKRIVILENGAVIQDINPLESSLEDLEKYFSIE